MHLVTPAAAPDAPSGFVSGDSTPLSRRVFILGAAALLSGAGMYTLRRTTVPAARPRTAHEGPHNVTVVRFTADGQESGQTTGPRILRSDAEWRQRLSPAAYRVMRQSGTETAYSGALLNEHRTGLFACAGCDLPLFGSKAKYDSHTGWPSFYEPLASENILEIPDGSLMSVRTAVSCHLCDSHLGHVFTDGPKPTGLRYCINSVALTFTPA